MFDLEDTMLDDAHCQIDFTIDQQSEGHEILGSAVFQTANGRHTLSHPYFSLKRAPGTMKGIASSLSPFCSMANARIPGASLSCLTNAGSSHFWGKISTWRFRLGLARALSARICSEYLHLLVVVCDGFFAVWDVD